MKGAGRWLAFPLALAFMVRIAGAGLLRLAEGLRMGPWWRRWGRWTRPARRAYLRAKHLLGWRDNELKRLLSSNVDRELEEIRVAARDTKGKKPLLLPYGATRKPLKDYRGAWEAACTRAGLAWTVRDAETAELRQVAPIPHDLRRSAARDWRPYMSEREIMNLCGWKSRATFERYDIQDPKDGRQGFSGATAHQRHNPTLPRRARST